MSFVGRFVLFRSVLYWRFDCIPRAYRKKRAVTLIEHNESIKIQRNNKLLLKIATCCIVQKATAGEINCDHWLRISIVC